VTTRPDLIGLIPERDGDQNKFSDDTGHAFPRSSGEALKNACQLGDGLGEVEQTGIIPDDLEQSRHDEEEVAFGFYGVPGACDDSQDAEFLSFDAEAHRAGQRVLNIETAKPDRSARAGVGRSQQDASASVVVATDKVPEKSGYRCDAENT